MADFTLHPQLSVDTAHLLDWPLCRVLLLKDARYPWLVLVPRQPGLTEWHDLPPADHAQLSQEVLTASRSLKSLTNAAKINIGALGNLVPQLHIHIIARNPGDPAWPGPVWGHGKATDYPPDLLQSRLSTWREKLGMALAP